MEIPDISERPMASMESYSLGLVASLLLREMSTPNFQYEIQMGSTPATTLLKGIQSTPTPTDPVRQAQVEQGISTSNSEFGLKIDPYLSNMNNRDYTAVSIPWDDHVGSYNPGAFIKVESYPQAIIMPTFGAVFENSGKGMSVRSKDNAVALVDNSCGKQQVVFLIRKSDVITNPEGISINLPTLQIRATKDDRKADPFFKEVLLCL
jgi:hypothetical protein